MNPGIGYGGDYNPEQWPAEVVDEDIKLMLEAGVTLVTVGVFSWAALQPRPGEFTFGWLDDVMDKLHAAGIGVDLATATASPPPWLGHHYPNTLPVTAEGVRLGYGSRQQFNPSSGRFRTEAARMARAVAERYADHPALVMWHIGNEFGCHVHESFDDESVVAFRAWLQNRYGTLDELNRVWGTTFWSQRYSSWNEVKPPGVMPAMPNPHLLTDWRRFCSDALLECYRNERAVLAEVTPNIPVTTNFMGAFPWIDYWAWAAEIDIITNDSYPDPADPRSARDFAFESDLMRSLGGGKPFLQLEQTTSAVQWRARNAVKRPGQFRLWSLQTVARGADGIFQFQWRQSVAGAETFHSAMLPHSGTGSRVWADVKELGGDLARLTSVVGTRVPADVAIVWDWQSAWAMRSAIGPVDTDPLTVAKNWHASLFEAGISTDFVHPGSDLSGYRVVIVPALYQVSDEFATSVEAAATSGATVLVTCHTGIVDSDGHAYRGGYLGPLIELMGVRVLDFVPLAVRPTPAADLSGGNTFLDREVDRISSRIVTTANVESVGLSPTVEIPIRGDGGGWVEDLDVIDAQVIAQFDSVDVAGWPAITRRQVGKGSAWYVATDPDARARAGILHAITANAGVAPALAGAPAGVEVVRRGTTLFLLNHSDETVEVEGVDGVPVLGPAPVRGRVVIPPRDSAVLEVG